MIRKSNIVLFCAMLLIISCGESYNLLEDKLKKNVNDSLKKVYFPKNAKWSKNLEVWSDGSYAKGTRKLWYKDKKLFYMEQPISKNYKQCIRLYENGKIKKIYYQRYFNLKSLFDDTIVGWRNVNIEKIYNKKDQLVRSRCYTLIKGAIYTDTYCGNEKIYKNGKLYKIIKHEQKCKYGCDM